MSSRKLLVACTNDNICSVMIDIAYKFGYEAKTICNSDLTEDELIDIYNEYLPDISFFENKYACAAEICRGSEAHHDVYLMTETDGEYTVAIPFNLRRLLEIFEKRKINEKKLVLFDDLIIDDEQLTITVSGNEMRATLPEVEMLKHFTKNPNRVFSREQLAYEVFGPGISELEMLTENTVELLKEKLDGASGKWRLKLNWGVGYKFEVANKQNSDGQIIE